MNYSIYNAYPIFDWKTLDIWIANGKFGWTYNHLYDLYYQAGVPLSRQRVASPFISQAISTLFIYKVVDPDMWGRTVGRVNGVVVAGIYLNNEIITEINISTTNTVPIPRSVFIPAFSRISPIE